MQKKTRLIILFICVTIFIVITPNLVLYSMGYRIDLTTMKITATGGIYVRTFPTAEKIFVDSGPSLKPGLFSNSIFVQNLVPSEHSVLVQKDGYFDYEKTIPVKKNQVTKLENILLIKRNIEFQKIIGGVDYFSVAPNKQTVLTATEESKSISFNYFPFSSIDQLQTFSVARAGLLSDIKWSDDSLFALLKITSANNIYYYLFNTSASPQPSPEQTETPNEIIIPLTFLDKTMQKVYFNPRDSKEIFYIKNNTLYSAIGEKIVSIIADVVDYGFSNGDIIWFSKDGSLYKSDSAGKLITQLTAKSVSIKSGQLLETSVVGDKIFIHTDNSILFLNPDTKMFENLPLPAGSYEIIPSPDYKNLIFKNGKEIYLYSFADDVYEKIFSGDLTSNCQWLNNYYIVFASGDKIIISEIDTRGNINTVTLPETIKLEPDSEIKMTKPETFFNPQDSKIYFLTSKTLISSERILP